MAYNQYGTFNPAALEPYPIETELAKQATEGSGATAGTLLDQYWLERQANKNLYGQELDAQHEQARQQIAAQMADARYKALSELGKTPGGWELAAGSPELSQIFGGSTSLPAAIDVQRKAQAATNLEKAGSGSYNLVQAGTPANIQDVSNITGVGLTQGTPLSTINAQIAANARLAAARLHAAAASMPSTTVQTPPDPEHPGVQRSTSFPGKLGMDKAAQDAWLLKQGLIPAPIQPQTQGTTPSVSPSRRVPDLPMAKTEGSGAQAAPAKPAQATGVGNKVVMDRVRQTVEQMRATGQLTPAQYKDITDGYVSGNPAIGTDGKLRGKSGRAYN